MSQIMLKRVSEAYVKSECPNQRSYKQLSYSINAINSVALVKAFFFCFFSIQNY